jgi:hypothetical protein
MPLPQFTDNEPADLVNAWFEESKGVAKSRPALHKIAAVMLEQPPGFMETSVWYWTGQHLRRVTVTHGVGDDWVEPAARALEADFQRWLSKS